MLRLFSRLDRYKEYGPLFIRLIIGWHLAYGTHDNVFQPEKMLEFRGFLTKYGFPVPWLSAYVSVYAQFICGFLYLLGLWTRPAAAVMIFNFIAALVMVHWGRAYPQNALAFLMLFSSLFLFVHGPGLLALDNRIGRRR